MQEGLEYFLPSHIKIIDLIEIDQDCQPFIFDYIFRLRFLDPIVIENSFNQEIPTQEKHIYYLHDYIKSGHKVFVFTFYDQFMGYLHARLDSDKKNALISFALTERFRGKRYAMGLTLSCLGRLKGQGIASVLAQVKPENLPSRKVLEACGFSLLKSSIDNQVHYGVEL